MTERQQPGLSTEANSNYQRGKSAKSGKRQSAPRSGTGRMVGTNLMVALLIAGLVLAGWFIANQRQMLAEEQTRLSAASDRIAKLEDRSMATDSALSQEGQDTSQKIGLWESEIRKLWAISNDRNKNWIKDNERGVSKLNKTLNGIEASNRDLKASVGRHDSAFAQQQALIDQLTSLELQMQQIVRGQRDLVDKVNSATQSVASMRASFSGKVDDNSEAIQSIDAYRVAVNSRLGDMERRLNTLAATTGG
jgi:chromosome segregation ATPase